MSVPFKICGITRAADALAATEAGAWAVGFVLWPGSPRSTTLEAASEIASMLPPHVAAVPVMVDATAAEVREAAIALRTGVVQLHGSSEPPPESLEGLRIVRAASIETADRVPTAWTLLLDAHDPAAHGGTGRTIDWVAAASIAASRPTILAGGLRPENVAEAIARVRPIAVDLASGVERSPGIKDHEAITALAAAIRSEGARR